MWNCEGEASVSVETAEYWRCQGHETTTKESYGCGTELF